MAGPRLDRGIGKGVVWSHAASLVTLSPIQRASAPRGGCHEHASGGHGEQLGVWMETATAESTGIGKAAQALTAALIAYAAQKDIVAKKEAEEVEGTLVAAMKAALDSCGISVQRYWNATLVGPDCRRFLEKREEIVGAIRAAMLSAKYGTPECNGFVQRHTSVLEPLDKVLHLTRKANALCPSLVRSPPLPRPAMRPGMRPTRIASPFRRILRTSTWEAST